jgi:hypothetical protein
MHTTNNVEETVAVRRVVDSETWGSSFDCVDGERSGGGFASLFVPLYCHEGQLCRCVKRYSRWRENGQGGCYLPKRQLRSRRMTLFERDTDGVYDD